MLMALAFIAAPSILAQTVPPGQKPVARNGPAMEQEVIVTGRRDGEPDFQEQQEYHFQEYRRLKQIYDPDPLPVIRSDRLVRMPEAISSTVQGKPTLTEKQW
ncbi:hypothetical protein CHU95_18620 [Niveispirillum lacus]|uniref:Uncharacterized protein n=2 Tax=Niveispirillum lacus TaxID=1981099 RepID=A0A255YU45_9PROT|nr:hypothetical protein CHU95_18620 [Niveispirillum lacus]